MEVIPKSRYPGDPQGQAFAAGVQSGWVVKAINGSTPILLIMLMLEQDRARPVLVLTSFFLIYIDAYLTVLDTLQHAWHQVAVDTDHGTAYSFLYFRDAAVASQAQIRRHRSTSPAEMVGIILVSIGG